MLLMKNKIRTRSSWASAPATPLPADGELGPIQHLLYFAVALQFGAKGRVGLKVAAEGLWGDEPMEARTSAFMPGLLFRPRGLLGASPSPQECSHPSPNPLMGELMRETNAARGGSRSEASCFSFPPHGAAPHEGSAALGLPHQGQGESSGADPGRAGGGQHGGGWRGPPGPHRRPCPAAPPPPSQRRGGSPSARPGGAARWRRQPSEERSCPRRSRRRRCPHCRGGLGRRPPAPRRWRGAWRAPGGS